MFPVKGAKYDPSGRPPKGVPTGCNIGWVGPPAGLKYPDRPPDGEILLSLVLCFLLNPLYE